jgi:KaiC/GvpD/RAD55 family RecA-like ATPase
MTLKRAPLVEHLNSTSLSSIDSGRGEKGLYITLSERESELRRVAGRHGWSLDPLSIFELIPPEASLDPEREQTLFHPAELELSETSKLIFDRVIEVAPVRVVLDSLSEQITEGVRLASGRRATGPCLRPVSR